MTSKVDYPLKDIAHPHPHDVLCGRGGGTNNHVGNSHWRMLVATNKQLYIKLPKKHKMLLSRSIVDAVRSQNPPGRFLQKDETSGLWNDVGNNRAQEKTSQALREGAPEIRTNMTDPSVPDKPLSMQTGQAGWAHPEHMPVVYESGPWISAPSSPQATSALGTAESNRTPSPIVSYPVSQYPVGAPMFPFYAPNPQVMMVPMSPSFPPTVPTQVPNLHMDGTHRTPSNRPKRRAGSDAGEGLETHPHKADPNTTREKQGEAVDLKVESNSSRVYHTETANQDPPETNAYATSFGSIMTFSIAPDAVDGLDRMGPSFGTQSLNSADGRYLQEALTRNLSRQQEPAPPVSDCADILSSLQRSKENLLDDSDSEDEGQETETRVRRDMIRAMMGNEQNITIVPQDIYFPPNHQSLEVTPDVNRYPDNLEPGRNSWSQPQSNYRPPLPPSTVPLPDFDREFSSLSVFSTGEGSTDMLSPMTFRKEISPMVSRKHIQPMDTSQRLPPSDPSSIDFSRELSTDFSMLSF